MAESDFSWRKILSFFGAAALVFVAFVTIATGGNLIHEGRILNGIMTCFGGASALALAVVVYISYQKWSSARSIDKVEQKLRSK